MKIFMRCTLAILATALLSLPCVADTYTYTYVGNDFTSTYGTAYTTSDFVTVEFTLASALAANLTNAAITLTSFSFSDGVQTITDTTPFVQSQQSLFTTGADGSIEQWVVATSTFGGGMINEIFTENFQDLATQAVLIPADQAYVTVAQAFVLSPPGTWTVTDNPTPSAVPEPSSLFLLGTGSAGLLSLFRRVRNDNQV